jgi:hypothetical protein
MALSTTDLLTAIKGLKGEDLKLVRKALGSDEKKVEDFSQEELAAKLRILDIERDTAQILGEKYNASLKANEQIKVLEQMKAKAFVDEKKAFELMGKAAEYATATAEKKEKVLKEANAKQAAHNKGIEDQIVGLRKQGEATKDMNKELKESYDKTFTGIAVGFGLNSRAANSFIKGFNEFRHDLASGNGEVQAALADTLSPQKIMLGLLFQIGAETLKLATAVDKATAAFAGNTGAGRMFTAQISNVGGGFRNLGLSAEDAGKSVEVLFSSFRGFQGESQATQENLMKTVAGLEKLGVGSQESADVINFMNINLGKSGVESAKLTKQMALTGKAIGMTAKQMVSGFKESLKSLAVYGKGAAKVFTNLASQAKAAGVEVSTLLGLAGKFDTFSGAAETAGKLNAILGTQLSATELLTMKEDERIETLISSIQAQGIAFKEMGKFEQQAIAAAAGISDMNEAQKIFGMSIGGYKKFSAAAEANAKSEQEFNDRMKEAMDIMKKLEMIAANFAVQLGPFIDTIASGAQYLLDLSQATRGWGAALVLLIPMVAGLALFVAQLVPLLAIFGTTAAPAAAVSLEGLGAAGATAAPGIVAAGAALIEFGLGVIMVIMPIALLVTAIAALVYAFSFIISKLIELVKIGIDAPGAFMAIAVGIGIMGLALMGLANPIVWYGMTNLAGILAIISLAIAAMPLEKLEALSTIMGSLTGGEAGVAIDFSEMDKALNTMVKESATIQPILGDLALMTVGQNSAGMTVNSVQTNLQSITADIQNLFKFNLEIPGDKLADVIDRRAKEMIRLEAKGS